MEIGDLNSDLYFKYANNIYIKKKGSTNEYIQFFDSEGNPNIKLKNPISAKDPYSTESSDGFYYYDNKLYIKIGNNVIDLSLQGSSLPEGSIIMYKGTSAPEGWSDYGGDTGISGVIYITNGNSTRDRITIELSIIGLNNNTATVGSEYTLQAIIKKDGQSYSNYNANEITYSTNDTEYATINGSKITPKKYKDGGVTISASIAESSVHTGASTSKTIVIARKTLNSFSFSTTLGEITVGSSLDLKNYITGLDDNLKNSLQFVIGNLTINISLLTEGDYTIKAKLPQTDVYLAAESTNSFALKVKSATKPQPNISFNGNEGHANARGEEEDIPTLYNPNNVPVTYSSSVTSVATIDDNGKIDVVGVGTTIITATFTGNDLYAPQSVSYILTISPIVVTNPTIELSQYSYTYDGNAKTPTVTVKDGDVPISSTEYTVSYTNNTNVGTATVTITDKEGGNYTVNGSTTFTISESQQEEDEIIKSVNIATNSVYDEGGSSVDTENVKIIINDLRSDKTNNLLELQVNVIEGPQIKISLLGLDLNNINGNVLKGKTSAAYENETYTVIRVCDSTFQEGIIDSGGFYDVPNTGVTRGHLFKGGDCLTITILNNLGNSATITENTSSQSVSDKNIVVTVKNNTENDLVLNGIIKFHGSGLDTDKNVKFSNSNVVINSGSKYTSDKIEIDTNYRGRTLDEIIIYDSNNTPISIGDLNTTLQMGATYNIVYGEISSNELFEELLGEFNNVLYGTNTSDTRRIKSDNKKVVHDYLKDMFNIADSEYKKNITSEDSLFNPNLYTEPTNYRKTSSDNGYSDGDDETYKTMQAWLMATCLAELVTTTSSLTNILTELFNKAYSLGKQNIYTTTSVNNELIVSSNCYGIKQDPMIARYVATMIYAFNHDSKESEINNCRQTFGSKYININSTLFDNYIDNRDLGTLWDYSRGTNIGYFVNGDSIFGTPAGPFENANTKSGDLFYGGNHTYNKYWYDYNYKMDVAIDAKVREIYNMYDDSGNTTDNTFTNLNSNLGASERKKIKQAIVDASIVPGTLHFMWFGKKIIKFDRVINVNNVTINNRNTNLVLHKFVNCTPSDTPSDSNDIYEYVGPYYLGDVDSNLKNIWYTNSSGVNPVYDYESDDSLQGTMTSHMQFMRRIQNLADRHREFSYDKGYGRMRPLWNSEYKKSRGEIVFAGYDGSNKDVSQASTYNGLAKYYAQALLADSRTGDNGHDSIISDLDNETFSISDDFPADSANSWPSGHASQTWAPAMYLCQMFGNNSNTWNMRKQIIKQSYRLGSLRSIGRFHWNSDILFGRLYATMLLPILNATKTLFTNYNSLKTALIGSSNISAIDDSSYTEGGDADSPSGGNTPSGSAEITFNITNTSGSSISCPGRMGVILSGAGFIHPIDKKEYIYYRISKGQCELWNLDSGQSLSITVSFANDEDYESWMNNFNFANEDECAAGGRKSNVAFYDEYGVSHRLTPVNPTNIAIGGTYNVEYNSNIHNSPSYLNNKGEWIPGYDWGGGTWND